jgi:hypothetical protein
MDTTQSTMPMASAAKLPLDLGDVMAQMPVQRGAPPDATPPPAAAGVQQLPNDPAAQAAPAGPPYTVRLQADGSAVYEMPGPPGAPPIVIGTAPAPKIPASLQPRP